LSVLTALVLIASVRLLSMAPVRSSVPPPWAVIVLPVLVEPAARDRSAATVPMPVRNPLLALPLVPNVMPAASVRVEPLSSKILPSVTFCAVPMATLWPAPISSV